MPNIILKLYPLKFAVLHVTLSEFKVNISNEYSSADHADVSKVKFTTNYKYTPIAVRPSKKMFSVPARPSKGTLH